MGEMREDLKNRGGSSVVECLLAKEKVAGPNPVHRSKYRVKYQDSSPHLFND